MAEKDSQTKAVEVEGEIVKVQTLANGLIRLTVDLQEYCLPQAQQLMAWNREQVRAVIAIVENERDTENGRKLHI